MTAKPSAKPAVPINPREEAFQTAVQATFPEIFDNAHPKPLVVGVHRQLKEAIPDASMTLVRSFLRRWTKRSEYLRALSAGSERVGLVADSVEKIDPDHRKQAGEQLAKRQKTRVPRGRPPATRSARPHGAARPPGAGRTTAPGGRGAAAKPPGRAPTIVVKKRRSVQTV